MRALAQDVGLDPNLGTATFARPGFDGFEKRDPDAAAPSGLVDDEALEEGAEAVDERLFDQKRSPSNDALAVGRDENVAPLSQAPQASGDGGSRHVVPQLRHKGGDRFGVVMTRPTHVNDCGTAEIQSVADFGASGVGSVHGAETYHRRNGLHSRLRCVPFPFTMCKSVRVKPRYLSNAWLP